MQKCAKKQSYFFTIAFLITFCCVLINKLSFYTDCPKIPELVKQCFSNLSMSKCLIVSALSSAFPNDFPIFCVYRLIKSIYLQKCTVPDKLRTVHFFFLQFYNFSIFQTRTSRFQMAINKSLHHHQFNFRLDAVSSRIGRHSIVFICNGLLA